MFLSQKYKFKIDPAKPEVIKLTLTGPTKWFMITSMVMYTAAVAGVAVLLRPTDDDIDLDLDTLEENGNITLV